MGMKVIETNQTLNLAQYGLKAGDEITVICVGGGAGGSAPGYTNTQGSYCGNGGAGGRASAYAYDGFDKIWGQTSQYGGKGGKAGHAGGKGLCSKGSGVIVIMW